MKNLKKYLMLAAFSVAFVGCSDDDDSTPAPITSNNVTLAFNNTFADQPIVLGTTTNTSAAGQDHRFDELKYVISNIRLVKADGTEVPYNVDNLDSGATIVNQAVPASLSYVLSSIPEGEYSQIKFGLGVRVELNDLDEFSFPTFYAAAGANDTQMMWDWGTGYRFTKIEGVYGADNDEMSIHTGSTIQAIDYYTPGDYIPGDPSTYTQGVDAYRDITLSLPNNAVVGDNAPTITIKADFDKLLSGDDTITLSSGTGMMNNATPNIHTAVQMTRFVNNMGGAEDGTGSNMFSVTNVEN